MIIGYICTTFPMTSNVKRANRSAMLIIVFPSAIVESLLIRSSAMALNSFMNS